MALDGRGVAPADRPGERGRGPEGGDVGEAARAPGRGRPRPAPRRWPPPARPGRAAPRGGSRRSPRRRGSGPSSVSATCTTRPRRLATTSATSGSPSSASPNQAPTRRSAPRSASGRATSGWSTARRRCATERVEPGRARQVGDDRPLDRRRPRGPRRRWRGRAWRSGPGRVPAAAGARSSSRPRVGSTSQPARESAVARDVPARPGPMIRTRVMRSTSGSVGQVVERPEPPHLAVGGGQPVRRGEVGGQVGEGGQHEAPLPHPGVGHLQVGRRRRSCPSTQQHVDVERARAPPLLAHPPGRGSRRAADLEQLAGRRRGVELDDQVEVRPLLVGPADGIGLVDRRRRPRGRAATATARRRWPTRSPRFEPSPRKARAPSAAPGDADAGRARAAGRPAAAACAPPR